MIGDSDLGNVINRFDTQGNPLAEAMKILMIRLNNRIEYLNGEVDKLNEIFYDAAYVDEEIISIEEDLQLKHDWEQQYYNTLEDEDIGDVDEN